MAIFTDTRELNRQASTDHLDRVKGLDKTALAVLGYKDDGTRNAWGKINPMIGGIGTNKLAQTVIGKNSETGTDTLAALKGTEKEAINNTLNKAALAATIMSAGTGAPIMGAISKGLGMITGSSDKSDLFKDVSNMAKKEESMEALDSVNLDGGYSEQTIDGVTTTMVDGNPVMIDGVPIDAVGGTDAGGELKNVLGSAGNLDILQSGIGAITSEVALNEAEKEAVVTSGKKSMNQFSYL